MLLLLDILHSPVLESPACDIRFGRGALDIFGILQGRVPVVECGELDQVYRGSQSVGDLL